MSSIMTKAGELGLLGVCIPEQYGGLGMSFNTGMLIADIVASTGSFTTAFGAHTGIGTLPILYYGDDTQKEKYLPYLSSGEWKACYCLTEPDSGSDANAAKTKAETDILANRIIAFYEIPVDGKANQSAREMIRGAGGPSIMPPADRPG